MKVVSILYIASPSYSGSTLLSRLLNAHSQILCVGELRVLSNKIARTRILAERQCSCGIFPIQACPFWQSINHFLHKEYQLDLTTLNLDAPDDLTFMAHNHAFFEALSAVSNLQIIVDSSKNWERAMRLQEAGYKVIPIRLQRHPLGVINSAIKYHKPWFQAGIQYWTYYQKIHPHLNPDGIRVQYEQLAQHPATTLQALMNAIGLSFEPKQLSWANTPSHYIGGNPMRYQKQSHIKLDQKWKQELSWEKRFFAKSVMLLCRLPEHWQYAMYKWLFRR